jgi:hypothetical protein
VETESPDSSGPQLAQARARGQALLELVDRYFPIELDEPNTHDNWPVTGAALMARAGNLLAAILAVQDLRQRLEGSVLHRVLFEHVVTFAWLGFDPPSRMPNWLSSDARQRLDMANDWIRLGHDDPLDEAARTEMVRRSGAKPLPTMVDMTNIVDGEWPQRLPELAAPTTSFATFRGIYASLFRESSAFVHARIFGIEPLVRGGSLPQVAISRKEKPMASANTFTLAPITFAMGLFVCTEALGWPSRQSIHEVFESNA